MSNASEPEGTLPPRDAPISNSLVPKDLAAGGLMQPLRADPWVKALFNFSQAAAAKPRSPRVRSVCGAGMQARDTAVYSLAETAPQLANPLDPLRDRDRQALGEIFAHDQMATIEADILDRLNALVPEPDWDVEPYEFLREFL